MPGERGSLTCVTIVIHVPHWSIVMKRLSVREVRAELTNLDELPG
jgi:hypothetical protein